MTISQTRLEKCRRARQAFKNSGIDIVEWSKSEGFNVASVYAVLSGRNKGTRGNAHHIAIKLGLKQEVNLQRELGINKEVDIEL